jgi:phytoene dehydrogenase-like protein
VVSLLRPEVIRELELAKHGLHILPHDSVFVPMENGDYLAMYPDADSTRAEMARHSARDAEMFPLMVQTMYELAFAVKPILGSVPPNIASPSLRDLSTLKSLGQHMHGLGKDKIHNLMKIMTMSVSDFLDEWYESDVIKATAALGGIIGTMLGAKSPGSAYVLLHHYMGELDGAFTAWGCQKGGTGGVSDAIANAARSHGAEIRCNAPVAKVIVKNGKALGVALENGDEIYADTIVTGVDPKLSFQKLLDEKDLPSDFTEALSKYKYRGSSGKVNLALDGLPHFPAMKDPSLMPGMIGICPGMDYLERGYDDAVFGGFSERPAMDACIPSITDPTLAPPGKHVMSLFVQYCSYDMPENMTRDEQRDAFGDAVIDAVSEFSPNLKELILHKQVLTPWDIEQMTGLTQGNIFQGELTLDQLFFLRPAPGWADYRTPIRSYYQCGSSTHPGGGITAGPGRLAALEILKDTN